MFQRQSKLLLKFCNIFMINAKTQKHQNTLVLPSRYLRFWFGFTDHFFGLYF